MASILGQATVILDSGFWKTGRINVVADVRFCMYVAGGCGVVDVLWFRKRDITTLPCHVGLTPRGIRRLREETSVESTPYADIDKSLDLEKFSKRNDSDFSLSLARS